MAYFLGHDPFTYLIKKRKLARFPQITKLFNIVVSAGPIVGIHRSSMVFSLMVLTSDHALHIANTKPADL